MTKITKEQAKHELLRRKCHESFWSFCLFMNYDFWKSREEQMKQIANAITELYEHGGKMAISTPPRTGKSMLANHFICWCLLKDLSNSIIRASYSQDLSSELNQNARQMLDSPKFKSLLLEPLIEIENNKQKIRFKGANRANVYATSVGGSSTGFGGNIIIADDLYKDHNEALSDTINNKTINWYYSAFTSRQDGTRQIELVIGTRWRIGELVDILEQEDYFDKVFKIKALKDDGTSFNEEIITTSKLLALRNVMHESIFNSMYQQTPMEGLDILIDPQDINYIDNYVPSNYMWRLMVVDVADKGTDRTCAAIVDIYQDKVIVIDVLSDVRTLEYTEPLMYEMAEYYRPTHIMVEENKEAFWARSFCHSLQDIGLDAQTFTTTQNKKIKILLNSPQIKEFMWLLVEDEGFNDYIRRVCRYDLSQNNQHDDEIDVLAMIVNFIMLLKG